MKSLQNMIFRGKLCQYWLVQALQILKDIQRTQMQTDVFSRSSCQQSLHVCSNQDNGEVMSCTHRHYQTDYFVIPSHHYTLYKTKPPYTGPLFLNFLPLGQDRTQTTTTEEIVTEELFLQHGRHPWIDVRQHNKEHSMLLEYKNTVFCTQCI